MKKVLLLVVAGFLYFGNSAKAQTGQNSAGITIDVGDGSTLVGPAIKHFFDNHASGQAELLFGGGGTYLGAYYQYNDKVKNAAGLNWYLGLGPALNFGDGNTNFIIRPMAGLAYKISQTPINLAFDWRPAFQLGDNSDFIAARFGIGLRYAF